MSKTKQILLGNPLRFNWEQIPKVPSDLRQPEGSESYKAQSPTQLSGQGRPVQNEKAPPRLHSVWGLRLSLSSTDSLGLTGSGFCRFRVNRSPALGTGWCAGLPSFPTQEGATGSISSEKHCLWDLPALRGPLHSLLSPVDSFCRCRQWWQPGKWELCRWPDLQPNDSDSGAAPRESFQDTS